MKNIDLESIKTLDPTAVFSMGEAALLLGRSHNGMRSWVATGKIKAGKCGGRYFIPGIEIQKQIELPGELKADI